MSILDARRLLFLSPMLAMPSQHGGCVYPHAILNALRDQRVDIDYGWLGAPLSGGRRMMRNPLRQTYVARAWIRGTLRVGEFLFPATVAGWTGRGEKSLEASAVYGGEHVATKAERAFAAKLIRKTKPLNVLIDSTPMLTLLDDLLPAERARFQVAVLTHNLTHRRTTLYRQCGQPLDFLPMTSDEETALLQRADIVIAIQDREAEVFRGMLPAKRVITLPMPLTLRPLPSAQASGQRCLFVGGHSGHNIEAVHWLLDHVWPDVHYQLPEAELVVAGTVGKAVPRPPAGVKVIGPIEDLKTAYAAANLCLVPLPLGTGLKIKLVEAMSYGRAVLTTPAGAEGFADLEDGKVAVVANDAAHFSREILRLLTAPELCSEIAGRQLAWLQKNMLPSVALSSYTALLR